MKKNVFVFLCAFILIATLCLSACNTDSGIDTSTDSGTIGDNNDGGDEDALDIWQGVEGNEIQFGLTFAGDSINVVLNRDNSCYTYADYSNGQTINGEDINRPELEGALSVYHTNYGSYEIKDNAITATLDAQGYYRFIASGKDGDALKDAYFETNMSEEYREGYYGKGIILSEEKGTIVIACHYEGNTYTVEALTVYDENKVKVSESIPNADGSYKDTSYYPDGTVAGIREYDKDDRLIKKTVYGESGALEYVETSVHEDGKSVTTRTDADGNVIRTEERKNKTYENGGYCTENTIIENGVTIYHNLIDERCGEDGFAVISYNLLEEIAGNRKVRNISFIDHKDGTNNYMFSEEYVDDVLTYYFCAIEKVTVVKGVSGRQSVTYSSDTRMYSLFFEYVDESGSLISQGFDYTPDEYVHGDWETFEYVIE